MPLGAESFTELFATTLENYRDTLVDNVLTKHPILDLFKSNSKSETGRSLVIPLEAAHLGRTGVTDSSGSFSTGADKDIVGAASYGWSQPIVTPTRVVYEELQQNSGKHQLINLMTAHKRAAEKDHARYLAKHLHVLAANKLPGLFAPLDEIVHDTAPVGGIDPAAPDKDFWVATRRTSSAAAETIRKAFRLASNDIHQSTAETGSVTHILAGRDVWEEFEDSYDDKVRYVDFGEGETRFKAIQFGDIEVRYDPDCPVDRAYFLDVNSFELAYLNGNFMKVQPAQPVGGTLDFVTPLASIISVGTSERRANGVLIRTA